MKKTILDKLEKAYKKRDEAKNNLQWAFLMGEIETLKTFLELIEKQEKEEIKRLSNI